MNWLAALTETSITLAYDPVDQIVGFESDKDPEALPHYWLPDGDRDGNITKNSVLCFKPLDADAVFVNIFTFILTPHRQDVLCSACLEWMHA